MPGIRTVFEQTEHGVLQIVHSLRFGATTGVDVGIEKSRDVLVAGRFNDNFEPP
jgi:hypothetical protein